MLNILILGGGWYGCHLAMALKKDNVVHLWEKRDRLFSGASGANPARLHEGFHYPRSGATRSACLSHHDQFMRQYGDLVRPIETNLYAVAQDDSLVDFATYLDVMRGVPHIPIRTPQDYGLINVEGALLTNERHIRIDLAREFFTRELEAQVIYQMINIDQSHMLAYDLVIDCTFCACDEFGVDRYEACVVGLLEGPTSRAVTVMDGPFPSIYPWNEEQGLCSLSSALHTPFRRCVKHAEAQYAVDGAGKSMLNKICLAMLQQLYHFYPAARERYRLVEFLTGVRAMPRSSAAARLVDVLIVNDKHIRIRAGKIDAIFTAEQVVRSHIAMMIDKI